MTIPRIPLEDELGDVLDKALHQAELSTGEAAERAAVQESKLRDAIDYRESLDCSELRRLATVLGLNEVGLCALAQGQYPLPDMGPLTFCVHPLHMAHGIGVANAYVVSAHGSDHGLLFDLGPGAKQRGDVWPDEIRSLDAVFLTHLEAEHAGGLTEAVKSCGGRQVLVPRGAPDVGGQPFGEGDHGIFGGFSVSAYSTPGHSAAHNCYLVRPANDPGSTALLVSGDLIFAGSAGGAYFCRKQLKLQLRRMLESVAPDTIIAPGHGPLTTAGTELRYNPFVV